MFGGFVAELYPAAVRATGQGTSYNIGRMAGAVAPYTIGVIATQPGIGIGLALSVTSAFFLLAAVLVFTLPNAAARPSRHDGDTMTHRRQFAAQEPQCTPASWQMWVPCVGMALARGCRSSIARC